MPPPESGLLPESAGLSEEEKTVRAFLLQNVSLDG
jgi:hypothetical protein